MQGLLNKVVIALATAGGLGRSPLAPGTVGSLPGVLIAWAVAAWPWPAQAGLCAALTLAALPLCDAAERHFRSIDDHRIVADEYATFAIGLIGIPWLQHPWFLPVAFGVARVLDIVKPPPARQSQSLIGGLGIVADDLLASLYALAINHLLWRQVVIRFWAP